MKRRISRSSVCVALLSLLVLVAGCGEPAPTEVQLRPDGLRVGSVVQAVISPIAYGGGTYSRLIGPEGGTLYFGAGSLTFPRGAVGGSTLITATVDGVTLGVDFGPEGIAFPFQARPVLKLNSFSITDSNTTSIVYVDDQNRILSVLPTTVDLSSRTALAYLDHFSPYILAQN